MAIVEMVGISVVEISQGVAIIAVVLFGNRGQNSSNFGGKQRNRGRGRGRFDTSPSVRRPRVASKTIDKDKGRCFYCNEFGYFIRECPKKIEDEKSRRFSRMDTDYNQDGQYSDYDDTGIYTNDYDDEVFATLNRGVRGKHHPNSSRKLT